MSEEQTSLTHEEWDIADAIKCGDGELLLKLLEELHATGRQLSRDGVLKMASKIADLTRKRGRGRPKVEESILDCMDIGDWIENRATELKGQRGGSKTLAKAEAAEKFNTNLTYIKSAYTNYQYILRRLSDDGMEDYRRRK
jgi:hypothetical protein